VTPYPRRRRVSNRGAAAVRRPQVHGPVRAMLATVRNVPAQDRPQVPRPGGQHPAGDLSPDGAHPAPGTGVRSRAARRDLHHLDPGTGQHRAGRPGELTGPVPDQEPEPGGAPPGPSAGSGPAARSTGRPGARSRPGHGHGGRQPRSRRTRRPGARSPRSRHGRNRMPRAPARKKHQANGSERVIGTHRIPVLACETARFRYRRR
jgi:hypothetical protein